MDIKHRAAAQRLDRPNDQPVCELFWHLKGNPERVRETLQKITQDLSAAGLSEQAIGNAEVVFAEIFNNIVNHAYAGRKDGDIQATAYAGPMALRCVVKDFGHAMPRLELPKGQLPDSSGPLESLPEGGFGWFLIRQLTQGLSYDRFEEQNILTFELPY
ncbi:MAG: ATP-binding protein [Pseudomonadota bacterium]